MTKLAAHKLTAEYLGRSVRLRTGELEVSGLVCSVGHRAELISERRLNDPRENYVLGQRTTLVQLLGLDQVFEFLPEEELTLLT